MRKSALVSLFVVAIMATFSSKASAEALAFLQTDEIKDNFPQSVVLASLEATPDTLAAEQSAGEPEIIKHIVGENESLSKIAEHHKITWKRLFDKNAIIEHPDIIQVGSELVVPRPEEQLNERPLPPQEPAPAPQAPNNAPSPSRQNRAARPASRRSALTRGSFSGNGYVAGYCTWYAKSRRPDLPNNLGNANTWAARARAQGIPTGSTPRVGAIGQQGMHVVYIEGVHSNGTVTVSEMNFKGFGITSSRTVPANSFQYIY